MTSDLIESFHFSGFHSPFKWIEKLEALVKSRVLFFVNKVLLEHSPNPSFVCISMATFALQQQS